MRHVLCVVLGLILCVPAYADLTPAQVVNLCHRAVYTLETSDGQATAFAVTSYDLVTCEHAIKGHKVVELHQDDIQFIAKVEYFDEGCDFAVLHTDLPMPIFLRVAPDAK